MGESPAVEVSALALSDALRAYETERQQMAVGVEGQVEAAVRAGAVVVVSELLGDLIRIFELHQELPAAMGRVEYVAGQQSCIDHLKAYKLCVDEEVSS